MHGVVRSLVRGLIRSCFVLMLASGASAQAQGGTWSTKPIMPTARAQGGAAAVNNMLYVLGGAQSGCSYLSSNESFNPATFTWSPKAAIPWGPDGPGVAVVNGIIYAGGGLTGCGSSFSQFAAYDPSTNAWTLKAPMPTARGRLAMVAIGGIVYAVGGHTGSAVTSVVEAYDPATNTWTTRAPMPTARFWFAAADIDGILYAVGGFGAAGLATVEAYNPATDTWTTRAPMPTARPGLGVGVVHGILYAVGGGYTIPPSGVVEAYDPSSNSWTSRPSMPTPRESPAVAVVNDVLYAAGGHIRVTVPVPAHQPVALLEAFTPPPRPALTVSVTGGGTVTSSPAGINCGADCSEFFNSGTLVTLTAAPASGSTFAGWSGSGCSGTGTCVLTMSAARTVAANFSFLAPGELTLNPTSLGFGGQSMFTTSTPQAMTLTNTGGAPLTVSSISTTSEFAVTSNCSILVANAHCTADVSFTPTAEASMAGTLTVLSSAGTKTAILTGVGERSLSTHYYRSIFRRDPDAGGKDFWEGEAARVVALGSNVNEVWYSMTTNFFFSQEYRAFNRNSIEFLRDLYKTFFNRAPDDGGLAFWNDLIGKGLPREALLAAFMFSPEFSNFTQAIFGVSQMRPEVNTVMDFYRGLLSRMPDSGGYNFWLEQFRAAQCQGGEAVYAKVEWISSSFLSSAEYAARNRTHTEYVSDLYNAFMRRGADLPGLQYWVNEINTGRRTRESVRREFMASPEFNARVRAIITAGCRPPDLAILSVDKTSPVPLTPILMKTAGVDPSTPVAVEFTNAAGFRFSAQALGVEPNGDVIAAVPLYVSPGSGQMGPGVVSVTISQGGRTSTATSLSVQDLPPPDSAFQPGQVSQAYHTFNALLSARRINQLQVMQAITGNTADVANAIDTLRQSLKATIQAGEEIDRLMKNASLVISSSALPDGTPVRMDRNALVLMDRVYGIHLGQLVTAINDLPKSGAKQAVPVTTAAEVVEAMKHTKDAYKLAGNLQAIAHDPSFFYKSVALSQGALTLAQLAKGRNDTLGMVGAILGSTKMMVQVGSDYGKLFEGWRKNDRVLTDEAIADLRGIGSGKLLLTAGGLFLALPATTALLGSAAVPASLALAAIKLDMTLNEKHREVVSIEQLVAGLYRVSPYPRVGYANGTAGPGSGLNLCCLRPDESVSGLCDSTGSFDLIVPLDIPGANYGNFNLNDFNPVSNATNSTRVVDLRGLNTSTPLLIPRDCYGEQSRCGALCPVGGIAGLQCVNACNSALFACLGIKSVIQGWKENGLEVSGRR